MPVSKDKTASSPPDPSAEEAAAKKAAEEAAAKKAAEEAAAKKAAEEAAAKKAAEEAKAKESNPLVPKDKEEQPKKRIDAPKILHKESVSDSGIKFHIVAPDGSEAEIEADNVEDAIRAFNGRGDRRGKVFTFKQLKITQR